MIACRLSPSPRLSPVLVFGAPPEFLCLDPGVLCMPFRISLLQPFKNQDSAREFKDNPVNTCIGEQKIPSGRGLRRIFIELMDSACFDASIHIARKSDPR